MPRKSRIEYAGAVYHVISRGNYRKELFLEGGSGESFEKTIFEAAERCGWRLFAYVIMSNHYHLAMETPEPNLVEGMKWLQSTFATRFNRFRGERGHVFQGRYKSILVEEDRPLLGLIDYIHLNPVRAGLCTVGDLQSYRLSSFPKFRKRVVMPPLDRGCCLSLCDLPDSLAGMRKYQKRLEIVEESDPKRKDELDRKYGRGWFLGSSQAKKELVKELEKSGSEVDWDGVDLKELNESRWEGIVCEELKKRKISEATIISSPKSADWKIEIAKRLRKETTAKNPWIAKRLAMGHPNYVSNLVNG
ncbi:transposase [Puniceicoccus vermicola]|uniref:Transposase n=3 Tax=Puniceicoccus vermicola TaxID=388746 RepID=A0A7X1AX61_9BACT|nr:transposase [Puniceicoccus vermicola]MBC2601606.1 transposase [Puniceicoccus vermicola]